MEPIRFSDDGLFSYLQQFESHEPSRDPQTRQATADQIAQRLELSSNRLTARYLPLLKNILLKLESSAYSEYKIPHDRVLEVLRSQIRVHAQELTEYSDVRQACAGSFRYTAKVAREVLQLAEDGNFAKARLLLGYFLEHAPAHVQKTFFLHFGVDDLDRLRELLFEQRYPDVKQLCFANRCTATNGDIEGIINGEIWFTFFAELIMACPNIETLQLQMQQKGAFPTEWLQAIKRCDKLESIDLSPFYITHKSRDVLIQLAECRSLQRMSVQIPYTRKLLDLPDTVYPKIEGLFLRFPKIERLFLRFDEQKEELEYPEEELEYPVDDSRLTRHWSDDANQLIEKCKHLTRLRTGSLLPLSNTSQIQELEIVLPSKSKQFEFIIPFENQLKTFHSLKSLSFAPTPTATTFALEIAPFLPPLPQLSSLHVPLLFQNFFHRVHKEGWLRYVQDKIKPLTHLATQVLYSKREIDSLESLCASLHTLHLDVRFEGQRLIRPIKRSTNINSGLKRLILEVELPQELHYARIKKLCTLIEPFLQATNPEELVLIGPAPATLLKVAFNDEPEPDGIVSKMLQSLSLVQKPPRKQTRDLVLFLNDSSDDDDDPPLALNQFPRLQRLILCSTHYGFPWTFSEGVKPYVYKTFEVELFGRPIRGEAIDIDSLKDPPC